MVRQIGAMGDVRGKWAEEDGTKPRGEGGAVALRCRGRGSLAADGRALTGAGAKEDGVKPQGERSAVGTWSMQQPERAVGAVNG